ncbi:MAG: LysE family translocator, partial [Pseudomonadota bacterium]|nr:LysE family translocator [Pseudomonadota bacterium]
ATAGMELALMGATFMAMTFAVFTAYGIFAAQARDLVLGNARLMAWVNRSFAAIFAALAGRLALERA